MIRLLMKADDLGYSEAVNHGIERAVRAGLIRSVGLMPAMEAAVHGAGLLRGYDIALGMHTCICAGAPVSRPGDVPSMVDGNGLFKTSSVYRAGTGDFVRYEDAEREVTAQLERFRAIVGRDPDYFEGHAVASDAFFQALRDVAAREGLRLSMPALAEPEVAHIGGTAVRRCRVNSLDADYDPRLTLERAVSEAPEGSTNLYTCHPGYLDDYILTHSTLTVNRTRELAMLCDPGTRSWLEGRGVSLIDYRDL
ncbi:ChbG/HpnK family deacetylase [Collinsella intestinalis]|uniref:ChbG/HpnK family deacetylase n=1 Tax=Collinsella intestinalis TaxID=147207 RepID=UPI00195E5942|nr:ChbG/HpnK family deacetylase [Collinsella intestinalis]MBM6943546.1 ChbG/HpnK family deacetylase [Collinsella intestinalis]